MPHRIGRFDQNGLDYGWIMQVTFIGTVVIGAPIVGLLSVWVELPTWSDRAAFAVRVGAITWIAVALVIYSYARLKVAR